MTRRRSPDAWRARLTQRIEDGSPARSRVSRRAGQGCSASLLDAHAVRRSGEARLKGPFSHAGERAYCSRERSRR